MSVCKESVQVPSMQQDGDADAQAKAGLLLCCFAGVRLVAHVDCAREK